MTSQIRVDEITNRSGLGTVTIYDNGFEFTGVTTFTEDVDITGGLTIGGVLTYEDVTNIDSVGVVTARAGIRVTGDSIHVESSEDRLLYLKSTDANAYLTFEDTDSSSAFANRVGTVSDGLYFSTGGGGERLRITSDGFVGIKNTSPELQSSAARNLVIGTPGSGGQNGLTICSNTSGTNNIYFGDASSGQGESIGRIVYSHADDSLRLHTVIEERLRITSAGQLLAGATAARTDFATTPHVQIEGLDFPKSSLSITRNSNDTGRPTLFFGKSRGGVDGATNIVADGDGLGTIEFTGADGDQLHRAALIAGQVDGTPTNNGMKGRLVFSTNSGGTNATERLRITSAGIHKISTAGDTQDGTFFSTLTINNTGSSTFSRVRFDRSGVARFGLTLRNDDKLCISNLYQGGSVAANDAAFVMDAYSKIGINEASPTARLDINHPHTEQGLVVRSRYGNIATAMVKFDGDPDSNGGDGNVLHLHGGSSRTDSEILHIDSSGEGDIFDIRGDGLTRVYKQLQLEHSSNVAKIIFNEYGANDPKAQIEMDQVSGSSGQLIFRTQDSGNLSEKVRIRSSGGITFNGDTAAANALDDYEEGTWTPTCASASSVSYSSQYGRYTKIGNCITIWWDLIWTSLSGGNNARIGGLPYSPSANTAQGGYGIPSFRDASGTNSDNRVYGNSSYFLSNGIRLQHYNSSGNPTSGSFNGSGRITGWAQYFDNNAY